MARFDASANIAVARKWATAHLVAAGIICLVVGVILGAVLG